MDMQDLYAAYNAKRDTLKAMDEKIEKREAALDRLKAKRDKLWDSVSWVDDIVKPLALSLREHTAADNFKVYGPFGLRAYTSIYLEKGNMTGGITLTMNDGKLFYDTGEKTGDYEHGSIGELNGFDNVTAPLPDDVSEITALLHWFEMPSACKN